jgi:hypothetical protein
VPPNMSSAIGLQNFRNLLPMKYLCNRSVFATTPKWVALSSKFRPGMVPPNMSSAIGLQNFRNLLPMKYLCNRSVFATTPKWVALSSKFRQKNLDTSALLCILCI